MSALTKTLLVILLLVFVALGVEVFLYFQVQNRPGTLTQNLIPTTTPGASSARAIDITGKINLVGNLNLFEITKAQVAIWAKIPGAISVPSYSGPIPTLPPGVPPEISAQIQPVQISPQTLISAGYFIGTNSNKIEILQAQTKTQIIIDSQAKLWIKGEKLQIVSGGVQDLINSGTISQFIGTNDLILAPGVVESEGTFRTLNLVVFK